MIIKKHMFMGLLMLLIVIGTVFPLSSMQASAATTWKDYLDEKSAEQTAAFCWDESITDPTKIWDGTSTEITNIDADGYYLASTPSEFRWALEQARIQGKAINVRLTADIDLGGRNGVVWSPIASYTGNIDGDGHAINNFYTTDRNLITNLGANSSIKNIVFNNFKINTSLSSSLGLIGMIHANTVFENIDINNSYLLGYGERVALFVAYQPDGSNITFNKIHVKNSTVIAKSGQHHGTLIGFGLVNYAITLTNSFVVDSTLISYGSHSGGFIGCVGAIVSNCFANITVYGNIQTSAFAGSTGISTFENCYVTGKVEGTNTIASWCFGAKSITNCYSTAMVGMQNGGTNIGGMANNNTHFGKVAYTDCYVAGEVGSLTTPVNNTSDTNTAFALNPASAVNCYYDKQITGMREDGEENPGITGVLTQDKTFEGVKYTGLTSLPGTAGFTGFSDNSQWVFNEGLYPQLDVFVNADSSIWGEHTDLVKAYSLASVQTVYLENYEKGYDGLETPMTTYDTIRDITSKFTMSDGEWKKGYNTDGTFSDKTITLHGKVHEILTMKKIEGKEWVTNFAPGVEWMQVKTDVKGVSGQRIMRLCPTMSLDPGDGKTIVVGTKYDHRENVNLAYTTAQKLFDNDIAYVGTYNEATNSSTILNGSAMEAIDNVSKASNKMHILVYDFEPGEIQPDAILSIEELKDKCLNPTEVTEEGEIDRQYTGQSEFDNTTTGYHLIEYIWELPDDRYMRNGKIVTVKGEPYDINVNVVHDADKKASGENLDGETVKLGAAIGNDAEVSETSKATAYVEASYGDTATISWEIPRDHEGNELYELKEVSLRSGTDYTLWTKGSYNKKDNQFEMISYQFSVLKNNVTNHYDIISEPIKRVYPITKEGNTYSVTFNFKSDVYNDIEDNIEVNLEFAKPSYTIKYEVDGGNKIPDKENVKWNDANLLPEGVPEREGYSFVGWEYNGREVLSTDKYSDLATIGTDGTGITLTAKWKIKTYRVEYNFTTKEKPEGAEIPESKEVEYKGRIEEPELKEYEEWSFNGWYLDKELTEKYDFATPVKTDLKLYGEWKYSKKTDPTDKEENPPAKEEEVKKPVKVEKEEEKVEVLGEEANQKVKTEDGADILLWVYTLGASSCLYMSLVLNRYKKRRMN